MEPYETQDIQITKLKVVGSIPTGRTNKIKYLAFFTDCIHCKKVVYGYSYGYSLFLSILKIILIAL